MNDDASLMHFRNPKKHYNIPLAEGGRNEKTRKTRRKRGRKKRRKTRRKRRRSAGGGHPRNLLHPTRLTLIAPYSF